MTSASKHQVPTVRLALLAQRACVVIERHPELTPVRAIGTTLVPTALEFAEARERVLVLRRHANAAQRARDESRDALRFTLRSWLVVLRHGADTKLQRLGQSESILSLFAAAEEALGLLDRLSPELSAIARAELQAAHERALGAHRALIDLRRELNDQQASLRELAARLQRGLVLLRKALRITLGPTHLDYRHLCIRRRSHAAKDTEELTDDEVVLEPTAPVE